MAPRPVRKTPVEIKFRVDPADKAQADRIAASVGMDTNAAMKVMFKRFLAERGFPFDMKAPVADQERDAVTSLGVSIGRLAQISAGGFAQAARTHEKTGRQRSSSAIPIGTRRTARPR